MKSTSCVEHFDGKRKHDDVNFKYWHSCHEENYTPLDTNRILKQDNNITIILKTEIRCLKTNHIDSLLIITNSVKGECNALRQMFISLHFNIEIVITTRFFFRPNDQNMTMISHLSIGSERPFRKPQQPLYRLECSPVQSKPKSSRRPEGCVPWQFVVGGRPSQSKLFCALFTHSGLRYE